MAAFSLTDLDASLQNPSSFSVKSEAEDFQVIRRSGSLSVFDESKISNATTKAFIAVEGSAASGSRRIHEAVEALTAQIVEALSRRCG